MKKLGAASLESDIGTLNMETSEVNFNLFSHSVVVRFIQDFIGFTVPFADFEPMKRGIEFHARMDAFLASTVICLCADTSGKGVATVKRCTLENSQRIIKSLLN